MRAKAALQKHAAYLECALALVLAAIGLRLFHLSRLSRAGCVPIDPDSPANPSLALAQLTTGRIGRLARAFPGFTCLPQALATQWLIARKGGRCTLHVGVASGASGGLRSHAWATYRGEVVIGGRNAPELYRQILQLPPR